MLQKPASGVLASLKALLEGLFQHPLSLPPALSPCGNEW
jgi:hypothetical protein